MSENIGDRGGILEEAGNVVTPTNFKTIIQTILNNGVDKNEFLGKIKAEELFLLLVNRLKLQQPGDSLEFLWLVNQVSLLTTENSLDGSVCNQLIELTNNTKAILEYQTAIPRIIANGNKIKAAILVYLWKYKVCYPSLVLRYQPTTEYGNKISNNSYYNACATLSEKGILYLVDPRSETYRDRRRYLEHTLKRVSKSNNPHQATLKWYAVTKVAQPLLNSHIEGLKNVLPAHIRKDILTKDVVELIGQTHHEIFDFDSKKAKENLGRVEQIISQVSIKKSIPKAYVVTMISDIAREQGIPQIDAAEQLLHKGMVT